MKKPTHFKIDIGSISSDGDTFAPDCKFTFGKILEGEKEVIPTSEQIKHGLQFEILESHEENGVTKIDKVKLLSGSVISKMKPIFKASSTKIVEDEKGLTITQTGKYLGEGTLEEFVDKCNKYL